MLLLKIKKSVKRILCVFFTLIFFLPTAYAKSYYLQPGQINTVVLSEKIRTVFISNDSIANYEIVGDNKLIIYAKKSGLTTILAYDENDNIILNDTINVDYLLSQVMYRLKKDFPNSDISIDKYASNLSQGSDSIYVLRGSVPDTVTKDRILDFVGSLIGHLDKKIDVKTNSASAGENNVIDFMTKRIYTNIINRIDVIEESQINVKLTFVEVNKNFTNALGIEWQSLTLGSMIGDSGGSSTLNSIGEFSLLGLKKGFDIGNIATIVRAINNDKMVKILAEPNLSVLSGETASFLVGGEIPIMVKDKDGGTTIEYKPYGITLNVAAKVKNDKRIRLLIADEFSSVSGSYRYNDYNIPTLTTRKSSSTIDVADGDTFVIAGLISEKDEEQLSKIPFLGDIPILGAFARSASTNREKTELVVFATVNLITPESSFNRIELPVLERTDTVNLFFNIKNNLEKNKKQSIPFINENERFVSKMGFIE